MERTTTLALMTAILAAPHKGDYTNPAAFAERAVMLYDEVTKIARPLEGATVVGSDDLSEPESIPLTYPANWLDVAKARGAKPDGHGCYDAGELAAHGVQLINGCPDCGATVSVGGSYKISADNNYAFCRECAENRTGVTIND